MRTRCSPPDRPPARDTPARTSPCSTRTCPAVAARRDVRVVARERDARKRLDVFVPHVFLPGRRQRGVLVEERPRVPAAPGVALRSRGTETLRRSARFDAGTESSSYSSESNRTPRARRSVRSALAALGALRGGVSELGGPRTSSSSSYPSRDLPAVHPRPTWTRVPPPASCSVPTRRSPPARRFYR